MTDFYRRMLVLRNKNSRRIEHSNISDVVWNEIFGWVEMNAWFPVCRAVSPAGINVSILENINAP